MKKIFVIAAVAAVAAMFASCTQVHQGEFGIKAYQFGSNKGKVEHLGPGRYANNWFGMFSIYVYPANVQQHSWLRDSEEENAIDEQLLFQAEGQVLGADIGIEYEFSTDEQERVDMYRYFKRSPDEIVQQFIRKDIVSAFNKVVQDMTVEEVYSTKKDSIRAIVQTMVSKKYLEHGIRINDITYMSNIRLPETVQTAIDAKIQAKQRAMQRENEIAEKKAEAQKSIEEARGKAESARIAAEGRAKAIDIEGAALRRNPQILELKKVENQGIAAKSAEHWTNPVLSANQTQMLLGLGNGK